MRLKLKLKREQAGLERRRYGACTQAAREEMRAAKEREEQERKKAIRLQAMKSMPVLKRTEQVSNEIQHMIGTSPRQNQNGPYEEVVRNIGSLKDKLAKAKAQMAHNLGTEKQRRESTKAKLNGELVDAKNRLKKAKDNANVSMIKAIRQNQRHPREPK